MHNPTCLTELYNSCLNSCSKATLLEVANGVNDQILMVRQFAFFVQQLVPLPIYSNPFHSNMIFVTFDPFAFSSDRSFLSLFFLFPCQSEDARKRSRDETVGTDFPPDFPRINENYFGSNRFKLNSKVKRFPLVRST